LQVNNFLGISQSDEKNSASQKKQAAVEPKAGSIANGENLEIKTSTGAIPANISFSNSQKKDLREVFDSIINSESEEEQFNMLSETILANGGKIDSNPEIRNIVAFRNPNLPTENKSRGVYDDTTFVFWKEKDGTKKVKEFESNTDPNGLFTGDRPKGDFGRIVAGKTYTFGFSYSQKFGNTLMAKDKLSIERFAPDENVYKPAKTTLDVDKSFLFHDGVEVGNNTFSMGCQTFPRFYDFKTQTWDNEFNNFWTAMNGDSKERQKSIFYTILQFSD
jgi:hypothetical protein